MRVTKEYKVLCTGATDLTISSRGVLTMHDMTNFDEWMQDEDYPSTVKPLREEVGRANLCQHQVKHLIEVMKLVLTDLENEEKIFKKLEKEAKAKAAKKTVKKTKAKKVKKK